MGGTFLKFALGDSKGEILFKDKLPSRADESEDAVFEVMFEAIDVFQPEWVLIENVPGIKWMSKGAILESLLQKMNSLQYSVSVYTLHAEEYCVPQRRRRDGSTWPGNRAWARR